MTEETFLTERYSLAMTRIREIPGEVEGKKRDGRLSQEAFQRMDFFGKLAGWMAALDDFKIWQTYHDFKDWSLEAWKAFYEQMYRPLRQDYEISYANPDRASEAFGKEYGKLFSFLASEIYRSFSLWMMGHKGAVVTLWELFVEIYTAFVYGEKEENLPSPEELKKMIYWYVSDYSDEMVSWRIHEQQNPDFSPIKDIIMSEDLTDLRYLYRFGAYISDTELGTAEHMNRLSEEAIDAMAATFVDGYIRGFEVNRISLENKKYVTVRGSIGFERVFRSAVKKFREHGLEPVFFPAATTILNRRQVRVGYQGKSVNPQFEFDHCKDKAIYYDRAMANRHLAALKKAYEECREWISANAGPACFETFGEIPFAPVLKENACRLSPKQQKLEAEFSNLQAELVEQYMKSSEISFTIIAFPTPDIVPDY